MDNHTLDTVSRKVLGMPYYRNLLDFFYTIFRNEKHYDYIVFITRRSLCLAYIFLRILRDELKKDDLDYGFLQEPQKRGRAGKEIRVMTDSAFLSSSSEIADKIKDGENPKILICDDMVSYGRALNKVLSSLKARLTKSISDDQFDRFVANHVAISVYAKKGQKNLLPVRYEKITTAAVTMEQDEWNDVSNRFADLIINADVANAAFVPSAGIEDPSAEPPAPEKGWCETESEYRGVRESVYFLRIPVHNQIKAICTVRWIRCFAGSCRYRLVPFIFLPELSFENLKDLEKKILPRLTINEKPDNYTEKSRYEFITMYLSHCALEKFIADHGLSDYTYQYDDEKLRWNYCFSEEYTDAIGVVCNKEKLKNAAPDLISYGKWKDEYCKLISDAFPAFEKLANIKDLRFSAPSVTSASKWSDLIKRIEMSLFEKGIATERESYLSARQNSGVGIDAIVNSNRLDRYRAIYNFETYLSDELNSHYLHTDFSITEILAVILQMMDAGLMSIVINESDKTVSQNIRDCEQAMAALPKRYFCHLTALNDLDSIPNLTDYDLTLLVENYLVKLREHFKEMDNCSCKPLESAADLQHYLTLLGGAYQRVSYWNRNMDRHFVIEDSEDTSELITYSKYMRQHKCEINEKSDVSQAALRTVFEKQWYAVLTAWNPTALRGSYNE